MTDTKALRLTIDASNLKSFCNKLLTRSQDIAKTHEALLTLESFISVFGKPAEDTEVYALIESTIKSITEMSQQQLLEKNTDDLRTALRQCNIIALASVHLDLSRNGFYQILPDVIAGLSDDDIRLLMAWSDNWMKEARQLLEDCSGFPEVMDFAKAEISSEQFHAMDDLDRVLNAR